MQENHGVVCLFLACVNQSFLCVWVIPIVTRIAINPRQCDNCIYDANTRRQRRKTANTKNTMIRIFGFFVLLIVCFSSVLGDMDDNFIIHELVCTSIPVSRKKILTITHPDAQFFSIWNGLVYSNVDPCVPVRSHSVSLL
jgi:hypothetical protein